MTSVSQLQALAAQAVERLLLHPWKFWLWGDSIGFEGLMEARELTKQAKFLTFAHGALKVWTAQEHYRRQFDYTAPGVTLPRLYERTGDQALLSAAKRHADSMAAFRQTDAGAFVRY